MILYKNILYKSLHFIHLNNNNILLYVLHKLKRRNIYVALELIKYDLIFINYKLNGVY